MAGPWDAVDQGRIEPVRLYPDIALDTARSSADPLEVPIAGDSLYFTDDSTGKVYVRFNDKDAARIPASAGFIVDRMLFRRVYLDWTAQAGKVAQIAYATGVRFAPSNDVQNIGSITNPVPIAATSIPSTAQPYWRRSTSAALNTIVTPAANVAGVRIYTVGLAGNAVGVRLMAKASAPATWDDATALTLALLEGGSSWGWQYAVPLPFDVPAGLGVYEQAASGTPLSDVTLAYEVL